MKPLHPPTERPPHRKRGARQPLARVPWLLLLLVLVGLSACTFEPPAPPLPGEPLTVVATTGMVADVVRNVGGEHVRVTQLMGAGVDPHLFKASEGDVQRLASAHVIFYSGMHLEARLAEVLERLAESGWRTVGVAEAIPEALRLSPEGFDGFYDPHVWMDVKLWRYTVAPIRDALIAADPANAETYRANAARYESELDALEAEVQALIAALPPERRVLVTAHDAFNYFATGYGFEVFAPQGISTVTEASAADIRGTIDYIVAREVPAVFIESTVSPDVIEAVRAGAAARGYPVREGGELFTDAMGSVGTPEDNYIGMIRHNVRTIVAALGRSAGGDAGDNG